jgi:hypothetical protein
MVRLRQRPKAERRGARPSNGASRRGAELRRPELVFPYSGARGSGPRRGEQPARWRPVDVLLLVYAALRVMLPLILAILGAAAAGYGLFMLAFG